jgi:adhesin transport system outer membrane protein
MKLSLRIFSFRLAGGLLVLLSLAAGPAAAGQMTLDQAFEKALAGNPGVKAVEARIRQAGEQVTQARAAYFPQLDINSHAFTRDISRNDAGSSLDRRYETYDGFLSGRWVLFSGFARKHSLAAAKLSEDYEIRGKDDAVRTLLASVASSFHTAQLALANRYIASASREFYQTQLDTARIKQKAGVGSLSDVLNFNTRMNQAMIEMEQYAAQYDVARASLAALLGEEALGTELPEPAFPGDETPEEMSPPNPGVQVRTALENRPDLAQLALSLDIARANTETARSKFYPELRLNGSIGADNTGSAAMERDDIEHSVGLELNYPLFAGGSDRAALREALYAANEVRLNLKDLENQIISDVRQGCFTVAASQRQLTLYRENAKLVKQNRDMVAKEYQFGKTSLVNLNEVQNTLTETRQRIALSLISLRQAWTELKTSTGVIQGAASKPEAE